MRQIITGKARIQQMKLLLCGHGWAIPCGKYGEVIVGEKIARGVERATKRKTSCHYFHLLCGARMQEGMTSLMQMAKTSA